jgi:hypothetical protein
MNLMTLVRLVVLVVLAWIVVALGVGVLGVGTNDSASATFYIPDPSLVDTFTLGRLDHPSSVRHRLIDRASGRVEPLLLPADKAWSLLSVSPWRDHQGFSTAVARWISRAEGEDAFSGLGVLKLPGGTLANCISLEVLPTGKPCWVPGRSSEILFPAGDGQLYRCDIGGTGEGDSTHASHGMSHGDGGYVVVPHVVTWDNTPPGAGPVYVCDPVMSAEPALRNLVFVALIQQTRVGPKRVNSALKIWWLRMDDDASTIVAAGRLTRPDRDEDKYDYVSERMPAIAVGAGGQISLVYLACERGKPSWQMRVVTLEFDRERLLPRIEQRSKDYRLVAEGLALAPLVVSADARFVHALDISGAHCEHTIAR